MGLDVFIELIHSEDSTGCCIAAQVKSGPSFLRKNFFVIPTNRAHLEYWNSHVLPVVGIVHDPSLKRTAWIDIKKYINDNPEILKAKTHRIKVPIANDLSSTTIGHFCKYFLDKREAQNTDRHRASCLLGVSDVANPSRVFAGMSALFHYHRNSCETWTAIIGLLRLLKDSPLLGHAIAYLVHIPAHGDISWHKENIIEEGARRAALHLLRETLNRSEIEILLGAVDDNGFCRGSIGQHLLAIIDTVPDAHGICERIARDDSVEVEVRMNALMIFLFTSERGELRAAQSLLQYLVESLGDNADTAFLNEMMVHIEEFGVPITMT